MHDDRGDIITAYLLRLVGGLAVAGLLLIETAAVAVNRMGLEEAVERAANHGAAAYIEHGSPAAAESAARRRLRRADVEPLEISAQAPAVTVTGTRPATVLLIDRLDPLADLVAPTSSARAPVKR